MSSAVRHFSDTAAALDWLRGMGVQALTVDSRQVRAQADSGVGFIAWPGAARDGRAFVAQALTDGARACLVEADGVEAFHFTDERVATVKNLKALSADIAHAFYREPSEHLAVLAVTGTNGKTSTSWWTAQALSAVGQACGVVGTLGVGQVGAVISTGLTTPDPVTLHGTFRQFVDQGLKAAAIEASSIGIEELRLNATHITVAQFTNFTQDHLDYHESMQAYWLAKRALFDWPRLKAAVINVDDEKGRELVSHVQVRGLDVWTYGLHAAARLQAQQLMHHAQGVGFQLVERDATNQQVLAEVAVQAPVIGEFNVSNLLAVIGGLRALGVDLAAAVRACAGLQPVPGRMQLVSSQPDQPLTLVDYAHTPDALEKVLTSARAVAQARGGRLWCVFGCGGDRDASKRPLMGAMAVRHADQVVITSDNPRSESPSRILAQILAGVVGHDDVAVIEDRRAAIAHALRQAGRRDVVVLAGKGHETTQEVAGIKTHFSDVEEALAVLKQRGEA